MFARRLFDNLDYGAIFAALVLAGMGLLAIASATLDQPSRSGLWRMQLLWLVVACVASAVVLVVDYHFWAEFGLVLHGIAVLLLIAVFFVGKEVAGNRSWLVLGPFRLQPSEVAKWTTCLVLAGYLARRVRGSMGFRQMVEMGALAGVPMALVALQPDMGTALVFLPLFLVALVLGGVRWKVVLILLLVGLLLAPVAWTQLKDYQKERILSMLDPGRDPSGVGYQVRQSRIAIGSGGLLGKGLFRGTQSQLNFLPAQHTDFVLAVVGEELGFLGAGFVLGLFYYLLYRGIAAARASQDRLGTYLCLLVVAWLASQMAINVGMVLGLLPTIGVPLPLLSYGGSALVAVFCGIALILNVASRRIVN